LPILHRFSAALAFSLLIACDVAGAQAARLSSADESATRNWLRRAAQPLVSSSPSAAELQLIVDRLAGARVIGLGATQGAYEETAFKASLVEALAAGGRINAVAFEVNLAGGRRIDDYVRGGPGTAADALRESGIGASDATAEVAGLLDWLRRWNLAGHDPIRVVGFDMQDVLRDTDAALTFLAPFEPAAAELLRESWKPLLTPETLRRPFAVQAAGWTREQWETVFTSAQVLEDVLLRPLETMRTAPGHQEARHAARAARLGLQVVEPESAPAISRAVDHRRDIALGENLLALAGSPARVAVWSNDRRLARGALQPIAADAYNTGDVLADRLGAAYKVVGFASRRSGADPLGALLERAGERYWVDLAALPDAPWARRWRAFPYERGWPAAGAMQPAVPLGNGIDLLVFFRTLTPPRPLPPQ
jgi:erythromycin esterase